MYMLRFVICSKAGYLSALSFAHCRVAYQATHGESVAPKMWRVYWKVAGWPVLSFHRNRKYGWSSGLTKTCMNIASMSAEIAIWSSRNRITIPVRFVRRSGPVSRLLLSDTPL